MPSSAELQQSNDAPTYTRRMARTHPFATIALLVALLAAALAAPNAIGSASGKSLGVTTAAAPRTSIELKVRKCPRCRIQPVQNKNGDLTWAGRARRVRDGAVSFEVPTGRTDHMAFLVYARFDELAQGGIPMVVALAFKEKSDGARITRRYAAKRRAVSGCWRGTTDDVVRRTLRVTKQRIYDPIGEQHVTVAAGYFTRTLPARAFWIKTQHAELHASEPLICRP